MMLIALVALNLVHPGRIMSGKTADMPSRKARKAGQQAKSHEYAGLAMRADSGSEIGEVYGETTK